MATSETKQRRSPAEKALADALTEKAKKRVPDPEKFGRAARYADVAVASRQFEENYGKSSIDSLPIHHFHRKGESLVGIIGESQGESHGPSSFPFALDDGHVIRLPGNRRLAAAIRKADCLYQRIRVTYMGKLHAKVGGHYEKVYMVKSAPLGKEPMTPAEKDLLAKIAAEADASKGGRP